MGKKYIIDLNPDCVEGEYLRIPARIAGKEQWLVTKAALTPYAEPDLEQVRKEAYEKGLDDGRSKCQSREYCMNESYQRGLNDAWDAARKITGSVMDGCFNYNELNVLFGSKYPESIINKYSASKCIEKLKAYKQKQDAEIKVWDGVKAFEKKPFIVTGFGYGDDEEDVYCYGFVTENGISTSAKKSSCVKTGRHFHDIDEIFKEMREPERQPAAGGVAP